MKKIISYVLYSVLASKLPKTSDMCTGIFERFRAALVRGYVDYCGDHVNIQPHATIAKRVSIGSFSGVGRNCLIQGNVTIKTHVMMGPDVIIYTQNHAFERTDITMDKQGFSDEQAVIIEDDVWIGSRVTILPGVTISTGCVIGTGAVVTKSVPAYSVVAGNPARVVKSRITHKA